jgi:hypothetical protein
MILYFNGMLMAHTNAGTPLAQPNRYQRNLSNVDI